MSESTLSEVTSVMTEADTALNIAGGVVTEIAPVVEATAPSTTTTTTAITTTMSTVAEVTTILGSSGLIGLLLQVMGGMMSWQQAVALAVPAVLMIVWPESKGATAADVGKVVTDVLTVVAPNDAAAIEASKENTAKAK
ncbi:unnamed protein product [Sphagnum balticum]